MASSTVFLKDHNLFPTLQHGQNLLASLWQLPTRYEIQLDKVEVQDEFST